MGHISVLHEACTELTRITQVLHCVGGFLTGVV